VGLEDGRVVDKDVDPGHVVGDALDEVTRRARVGNVGRQRRERPAPSREAPVTRATFPESSTLPPIKLLCKPALPFRREVPQLHDQHLTIECVIHVEFLKYVSLAGIAVGRKRFTTTSTTGLGPRPPLQRPRFPLWRGVLDTRLSCTSFCQER
jgi:hypothetical protein